MININREHLSEIERCLKVMMAIPYGNDISSRIFPPDAYYYADIYNRIIEILYLYNAQENLPFYKNLLNIKDNQINDLIITYENSYDIFEINQKMKDINNLISNDFANFVKNCYIFGIRVDHIIY